MSRRSTIEVRAARAFTLKNYALAIRHLDELLELVGDNPQTLYMLALCHARQNQQQQALAAARRVLDIDHRHLATLKLLARLHFLGGEHDQARRLVARALEIEDSTPQPRKPSPRWLAALAGAWRAARAPRDGFPSLDAGEDRQWREWAEAYVASSGPAGGGGH